MNPFPPSPPCPLARVGAVAAITGALTLFIAAGIAQAYTGFSTLAMMLSMPASCVLLLWAIIIRHALGVFAVVVYVPGLLYWFLIHPLADSWRRLGPARTYLVVFLTLTSVGAVLFQVRGLLLGRDFGTNWSLMAAGAIVMGTLVWLGLTYGRRMNHLGHLKSEIS